MNYIEEGQVVDTYGGDYTYRDVWYEIENGEYFFYEEYYGAKPSRTERITDETEINEYIKQIKNR